MFAQSKTNSYETCQYTAICQQYTAICHIQQYVSSYTTMSQLSYFDKRSICKCNWKSMVLHFVCAHPSCGVNLQDVVLLKKTETCIVRKTMKYFILPQDATLVIKQLWATLVMRWRKLFIRNTSVVPLVKKVDQTRWDRDEKFDIRRAKKMR